MVWRDFGERGSDDNYETILELEGTFRALYNVQT